MEIVCEGLKQYFRIKGMTQVDIAKVLGTTSSYVAIMLNGKCEFGRSSAEKWSKAFGFSPAWLRTGVGSMLLESDDKATEEAEAEENDIAEPCLSRSNEEKIFELLEKSEARMDRTNDMCCKLSDAAIRMEGVMEKMLNEYSSHLTSLVQSRTECIELWHTQVESMQKELDFMRNEIANLHNKNEQLMNIVMSTIGNYTNNNTNTQTINVKK